MTLASAAETLEIEDIGAQRLSMGRAAADIRDSAGQLCDLLEILGPLSVGVPVCAPNPRGDERAMPPDLSPSKKLLMEVSPPLRERILAFQQLVEAFCETDPEVGSSLDRLTKCWATSIPETLENLRLAAQELYLLAGQANTTVKDDAAIIVANDGQKALVAIGELGRAWAKQQFLEQPKEEDEEKHVSCRVGRTLITIAPEITKAYESLADVRMGEKLRLARSSFDDIGPEIIRAADALAGKISPESLDVLCELAVAADKRTNRRFEQFILSPSWAGDKVASAQLIAKQRAILCRLKDGTDLQLCTPDGGDESATFANYLRATQHTWEEAKDAVAILLSRVSQAELDRQLALNKATIASLIEGHDGENDVPALQVSVVLANLLAERVDRAAEAAAPAAALRPGSVDVDLDIRTVFGKLASRLAGMEGKAKDGACRSLDLLALFDELTGLHKELETRLELVNKATSDPDRQKLIEELGAFLKAAIPATLGPRIDKAAGEFRKLGDILSLAELSDSGRGLVLAAVLQSLCQTDDGKVELRVALSLDPKVQPAEKAADSPGGIDSSLTLSLPLRRTFAVRFSAEEFRSELLSGRMLEDVRAALRKRVAREQFWFDMTGLCALSVSLRATAQDCRWPTALDLPAGAKLTFDDTTDAVTLALPAWIAGVLPDGCGSPIVISKQIDADRILRCLSQGLKPGAEAVSAEGNLALDALAAKELPKLKARATSALKGVIPSELSAMQKRNTLLEKCTPTIELRFVQGEKLSFEDVANEIRRRVALISRPSSEKGGEAAKQPDLPDALPVIELSARLSMDDCLGKNTRGDDAGNRRILGEWQGIGVGWSSVLSITVPEIGGGLGSDDPLVTLDKALEHLGDAAGPASVRWEDRPAPVVGDPARAAFASALQLSQHFELCKTAIGTEELRFWMTPLEEADQRQLPCATRKSGTPIVVARGPSFQSLSLAVDGAQPIDALTGQLGGELTIVVNGMKIGPDPHPTAEAMACAADASSAENRISFPIENASFTIGEPVSLGSLLLVAGWESGRKPSVAIVSNRPIVAVNEIIATVSPAASKAVEAYGLFVAEGALRPCVVDGGVALQLAADIGRNFIAGLLSDETVAQLAQVAGTVEATDAILSFIKAGQPSEPKDGLDLYAKARDADAFGLDLKECKTKEKGRYYRCDYTFSFMNCAADFTVVQSMLTGGRVDIAGDDIRLQGGCVPLVLDRLFSGDAADLPVTLADLAVVVDETVRLHGSIRPRGKVLGAAANGCAKAIEGADVEFSVGLDGAVSFDSKGVDALESCAAKYAAAAFADEVLPPNFDAEELSQRIDTLAREWLAAGSKISCPKPVNAGWIKVTCETITLDRARSADKWNDTVTGWCQALTEPLASVAGDALDALVTKCVAALSVDCGADSALCKTVVGGRFGVEVRSPDDELLGSGIATFTLPNRFTTEGSCNGERIQKTIGFFQVDAAFTCQDGTIALSGTLGFSDELRGFMQGVAVPPSPMSLSYNLRTSEVDVDLKAPDWRTVLGTEATRLIRGQTISLSGITLRAEKARVDDDDKLVLDGTCVIDWVERFEVPGVKVTFDLRRGGTPAIDMNEDAVSTAVASILNRYASSVSIPGVVEIGNIGVGMSGPLPESVSADVTVEAEMFKATLPRLRFDKRGVRFEDPFKVSLEFDTEILITPISLSGIRGTISEQFLSLGANATLAQAALSYVLMAKGDFTLPFNLKEDIVAIESMHAFRVVPLGQSTSRINVDKKLLSRTIDIGGALKPIIWLFGESEISPAGIKGDMKFAVFKTDLGNARLDVDFHSGLVTADGRADIGIGKLAFIFNGKQFALNPRLELTGSIDIGKFNLSSFRILARPTSASTKFRVLGVSLGVVVPSIKDITSGMLEDLIKRLISFDLKDLGKALEAMLSGNLTVNPFSGFGKNSGDGVAEGSNGEGGDGTEGAYPAASEALAQQGQHGEAPTDKQSEQAEQAAQQAAGKLANLADVPGASKPLLNPDGPYSMQFMLGDGGVVEGRLARAGEMDLPPLITMADGPGPHFSGKPGAPLHIVPTPIMLDDDLFVAAKPSAALFPYQDTPPTTGCPSPGVAGGGQTTTEVDLLLFRNGSSASHPRLLPAGLLGLCLEGFDEMTEERKVVLEAGLRVAAIVLPETPAKTEAPLKASWFDCSVDNHPLSGLSMLFTGEIFSRVVLKKDTSITQFRVVGFPYGRRDKMDALCRLLAQAEPADQDTPIDFIDIPEITVARVARGEMKLKRSCGDEPAGKDGPANNGAAADAPGGAAAKAQCEKEEWVPLETDHDLGPGPVPRPLEEELKEALDSQTRHLQAQAMETADAESGIGNGENVCVVAKDNEPWLALQDKAAEPFLRLPTDPQAIGDVSFEGFTLEKCGPVDGDGKATFIAYSSAPALPLMGRHSRAASGACAVELFWNDADRTKRRELLPVSPSYCSAPEGAADTFQRDMYLVTRELVLGCMFRTLVPAERTACLKVEGDPISIGGGWSDNERLIAIRWPDPNVVRLWAGKRNSGISEAKVLRGAPDAVKDFVDRDWKSAAVDVFGRWIADAHPSDLVLGPSVADRTSFLSENGALVLDLTSGARTEFRFRAASAMDLDSELIGDLVQQLMVDMPAAETVEVDLIGGVKGAWMLALRTDPTSDIWELRLPAGAPRKLVGFDHADISASLEAALQQLINTGIDGDIRMSRNSNMTLLTIGTVTRTSSFAADSCVGMLLPETLSEKLRAPLIEAWHRQLARTPVTPACGGQPALEPTLSGGEEGSPTFVRYAPGTLAASPAAHLVNADGRTLALVDTAGEVDSRFDAATQKLIDHAFSQAETPEVVERLGSVGEDKLRYGFGEAAGDETGLASPEAVCPFKRTEIFARSSAVLDVFLSALGSECDKEDFEDSIVFDDSGGVHSVAAPKGSAWSLHFASAIASRGMVNNAMIDARDVSPEQVANLAGLLARAYSEQKLTLRNASVALGRSCGPGSSCIFVASSGDDVFVAIDDPTLPARFWQLGANGPDGALLFDKLGENKAAAIELLRGDLTKLARDPTGADRLAQFCPATTPNTLLWPVISGGTSARQRFVPLKAGKAEAELTLALSGEHSCAQVRSVLQAHFNDGVTAMLSLTPRGRPEVWTGRPAPARQWSYSSDDCSAFLSPLGESDTAAILAARSDRLLCVGALLRADVSGQSTRTILISKGEAPTAWISIKGSNRLAQLNGLAATFSADHWKMMQLSDFVAESDQRVTTLARMDTEQKRQLLALRPAQNGTKTLTLRDASGDIGEIIALGVPDDTTRSVVAEALRVIVEQSDEHPIGIVMAADATPPNFWIMQSKGPSELHWMTGTGWDERDVDLQVAAGDPMQQLLALPDALVKPFLSVEDGAGPAVLKLLDGARVAITPARIVVEKGGAFRHVLLSDGLRNPVASANIIDRVVAALLEDPSLCKGQCAAGTAVDRFALLQGTDAHFEANAGAPGHAEIVSNGDQISIATLEAILAASLKVGGFSALLAVQDGLLFPRGPSEGMLVSPSLAAAMVYAEGSAVSVRLRDTSTDTIRASYPVALAELRGSLLMRIAGAEGETVGLMFDGETFAGCSPGVVRVLADESDWSISGAAPAAGELCAAFASQRLDDDSLLAGPSNLIKKDNDFVIFAGAAPKVEVAVWPNGGRAAMRRLKLPFSPEPDREALNNAVRELALGCRSVSSVELQNGIVMVLGDEENKWGCTFRDGAVPVDEPTAFVGLGSDADARWVTGSMILSEVEGDYASLLPALVERTASACTTATHVVAGLAGHFLRSETNEKLCDRAVLAWPAAGTARTILGSSSEIKMLLEDPRLEDQIDKMPDGPALSLFAVEGGSGFVAFEDDQHRTALVLYGSMPKVRADEEVQMRWKEGCNAFAIDAECLDVTALELARAALTSGGSASPIYTIAHDTLFVRVSINPREFWLAGAAP
ncbi:hypothetical protein [Mesorhizobium sp.]|uniref:hypothetical protein n=1 Tax=Mesorhizobium sp. TaxID=1871066 RepID=UPI000FEA24E0|nr:hypothetical protein [Mesorhizobium sp.]RWP13898.1 MAG: hypothetical protein EOQ97_02910 [Mesorhizobium sp.]